MSWEAHLRLWHAMLAWEHPNLFPGQVKPTPNLVVRNPLTTRVRPDNVAGTIRRFFAGAYRDTPPGPWRAALAFYAIVAIHGFADGNGRIARFVANLEFERAGWRPIAPTQRISRSIAAALTVVRILADLEPLVELFARAGAETENLMELPARTSSTDCPPPPLN